MNRILAEIANLSIYDECNFNFFQNTNTRVKKTTDLGCIFVIFAMQGSS